MRKLLAFALAAIVPAACHNAPATSAPVPADEMPSSAIALATPSVPPGRSVAPVTPRKVSSADVCKVSSVAQGTACPVRSIPPGTGTSPDGCKSDAECTQGRDGRCVRAWGEGAQNVPPTTYAQRMNLLAEPPRPPPRSKCVYDECLSDNDCSSGMRCACGSGTGKDRNRCIRLDSCLKDADCGTNNLCQCGQNGSPNACAPGNCRADADCGAGFSCETYCHSARDACRVHADCKAPEHMIAVCTYLEQTRAWGCQNLVPRPPG